MDKEKINVLLDKSCADALNAWGQGKRIDRQRAIEAMEALESKLGKMEQPDYACEYVPPAYVISYQLSHINLARHTLSSLNGKLESCEGQLLGFGHRNSLRIVDFGAGTSAGSIGAALMVAEAIDGGSKIDHIQVDEYDVNLPMLEMGGLVWHAFTQEVQSRFSDTALARAVEIIDRNHYRNLEDIRGQDCETWLIAFHVINKNQNRNHLKRAINSLYQQINPLAGAFSSHPNISVHLKTIFPFDGYDLQHKEDTDEERCKTYHTINWALQYGFRESNQRWRPYLEVPRYTLLIGDSTDIPF